MDPVWEWLPRGFRACVEELMLVVTLADCQQIPSYVCSPLVTINVGIVVGNAVEGSTVTGSMHVSTGM